jgi:hypothetical protein
MLYRVHLVTGIVTNFSTAVKDIIAGRSEGRRAVGGTGDSYPLTSCPMPRNSKALLSQLTDYCFICTELSLLKMMLLISYPSGFRFLVLSSIHPTEGPS